MNTPYGSAVYSDSTGVLLNNEMADFSTPGQHDVFDLPPAESNFIWCAVPPPPPPSPPTRVSDCMSICLQNRCAGPILQELQLRPFKPFSEVGSLHRRR